MIRYYTAGESHGKSVTVILEGIPAGLEIEEKDINRELQMRQMGYGRGKRMDIEKDKVEILSGIRWGQTIGSPICMEVVNRDWKNWGKIMSPRKKDREREHEQYRPRPGHADLPGVLKYDREDMRDILERASARETAGRVAAGAVAKKLLSEFSIDVLGYTRQIGGVFAEDAEMTVDDIRRKIMSSSLRCCDREAERNMKKKIDEASEAGDTIGGTFTVIAEGVPPGLGSHTQWDLKLDAMITRALMSIQAVKGVENGRGFMMARMRGSQVHDQIEYDRGKRRFYRSSNNAGGFEGGITNGERLVFNAVMKPISSLKKPLRSVNMKTKESEVSETVRSDVCAVPAAAVVGENVFSLELSRALKLKTGGDSLGEMKRNYEGYIKQIEKY